MADLCGGCGIHKVLEGSAHPGGLELTKRLAEIAMLKPGTKILEIGCGRGLTTAFLAQHHGCLVTGIDLSSIQIASAISRAASDNLLGRTNFMISDAQELPLGSDSFDVVLSECSLSLLSDKERVVDEVWRVLKPGGRFAMTDLVNQDDEVDCVSNEAAPSSIDSPCWFSCVNNTQSVASYRELLERTGFQNLYTEDCSRALKETLFRMRLRFGSMDKLLQEMACFWDESGETIPVQESKKIMRKSNLGYALVAATKQAG